MLTPSIRPGPLTFRLADRMPSPHNQRVKVPQDGSTRKARPNPAKDPRRREPDATSNQQEAPPLPRKDLPSARRRAWLKQRWLLLGDWQGAILPHPGRKVKELHDVIDQVLREADLDERMCAEAVAEEWQQLVGSFIASHSRPDSLKRGTLVVRVVQPTVRYALEGQKIQILQRLQQRFGTRKIRFLKFQIG